MSLQAPVWSPLLLALFIYPVLEEVVFRYGLLAWLDHHFIGIKHPVGLMHWVHNALVSVAFALAHAAFNPSLNGLVHAGLVFFPSMVLGYVWQRYQKLGLCILLHSAMNAAYWSGAPQHFLSDSGWF